MKIRILQNVLVVFILTIYSVSTCGQEYTQYYVDGTNAAAEQRYSDALIAWEKGAQLNDKYCCGRLAAMYLYGMGVPIDYAKAREWGKKGYELGNSYATAMCGFSYVLENGMDDETALSKALPYFLYSYDAEDRETENAEMYTGIGIIIANSYLQKGNQEEGLKWIEKIIRDYPDSAIALGTASYLYWGVIEDYEKAVQFATRADKENNPQGTFILGWCMAYGRGIMKDQVGGFKKIRKAAILGLRDAMYFLGECYYDGIGTEIDKQKAKEWFQKAAEAGDPDAKKKLDSWEENSTSAPEQSQKIHTITITAKSSEKFESVTGGKQLSIPMDSVKVRRYNTHGVFIDSFKMGLDRTSFLDEGKVQYTINLGAVIGDRFEISALGYNTAIVKFDDPVSNIFRLTLYLKKMDVRFVLRDSITKEPLIGASVFKIKSNSQSVYPNWDNWKSEDDDPNILYEAVSVTDIDGKSTEFKNSTIQDDFQFSYVGYKIKKGNILKDFVNVRNSDCQICTVDLASYGKDEDIKMQIKIGGMGINDKGDVTITNSRTNESFTMSQKMGENNKITNVRLGDELFFTRRGFRPILVKFKYHIPDRLNIAPLKGSKNSIQYLEF